MNSCYEKKRAHGKPPWLRTKLPRGPVYGRVSQLLQQGELHTVCQKARCPNQFECFGRGTATFLLLGEHCSRHCRFCNIDAGPLLPPDSEEPKRVAEAAAALGLSHVVLTSVTRDDLEDGGSSAFVATIQALRKVLPHASVEVLIPDFMGCATSLTAVLNAGPDVLNHNMETVRRLYPEVRPEALYERSLELIRRVYARGAMPAKSGIMLGLGEEDGEIEETLKDIYRAGCRMLTIGQYLQPSPAHMEVRRFVPPDVFDFWKTAALSMGFQSVASGPFVRSSYHAGDDFKRLKKQQE
ncbi:lipoyl synthase [Desulfobotulus sp. H1]|uniref:Lipoyl synthase n=1 Tax=Desulfobotulus pelophilus TaxID=2823377 RepID=A0ABT3NAE9_9BACT|nr:lipoyl synthase [Desulfobotulus pelophilus]MCW7754437.1 lipoyl synthase [Desulfobotulus pelophilus]